MPPPIEKSDARQRRESGAALVEFAFVLIPLLVLLLGIIDFGRAYGAKQELIHATREAVRVYAVTQDSEDATTAFDDAATGLAGATVNIPASCLPGEPVSVTASYIFEFIGLQRFVPGLDDTIDITSTAVMRCGG